MRLPLIALILIGAVRLDAVVVRGGDRNDNGDWWNGAKESYSFGELDGKVDATEWRAGRNSGPRAPPRSDGAAAERRWADTMGEAHPPTVSERERRNRAATKAVGAGPSGAAGAKPQSSHSVTNSG